MKIVLLGTGGYHPSERRHTACMLLPEQGIMLDAGTALFRAPQHLMGRQLDIFLTHTHLDHIVGLTFFWDVQYAYPLDRVTVHALPAQLAAIREHLFAEPVFPKQPPMEFRPLADEVALPDGGRLRYFPLVHPGDSQGFRLDWPGHSLAYVTDTTTTPDSPYLEAIRGVDLLLHECYFPDGWEDWAQKTGHSCTTQVAQAAAVAQVGRLVLVHIEPLMRDDAALGVEKARAIFPRTEVGHDGMVLEF